MPPALPAIAQPEQRSFRSATGVQIDISFDRGKVSEEEVLAALEQAVRQSRARLGQGTPDQLAGDRPVCPDRVSASSPSALPLPSPPLPEQGEHCSARSQAGGPAALPAESACGAPADSGGSCFPGALHCTALPPTLLWEPPLANPLQPRMRLLVNSLSNAHTHDTVDTAIGAEVGLARLSFAGHPEEGIQPDFFAVVLSRFASYRTLTAVDYRFGFPITFAWGDWQGKIGYEHTSTHLGDDFVRKTGQLKQGHIRDEIVVGCAYRVWQPVRLYGVFGYALSMDTPVGDKPDRFDWGVEWSRPGRTGAWGQPFAAFDMELRHDQDYQPNMTTQVGWQWRGEGNIPSLRVGLELYEGKSFYGQFFRDHEHWVGAGVYLDF